MGRCRRRRPRPCPGRRFWLVVFSRLHLRVHSRSSLRRARRPGGVAAGHVRGQRRCGSVVGASAGGGGLPAYVFDALVRYAAAAERTRR
ncbi:hypothetical protein ZWY2020_034451 [Hordeum vulgare]|nr:hypothetical protein ZWY2020_034451 [Hordeum vulgare]